MVMTQDELAQKLNRLDDQGFGWRQLRIGNLFIARIQNSNGTWIAEASDTDCYTAWNKVIAEVLN